MYNIVIEFHISMRLLSLIKMCLNEIYVRLRVGKLLSDMFPISNCLKQGDALWSLLFNLALVFAIRRVQVNQNSLKSNGTHQLLVHADNVNTLGGSLRTIEENTTVSVVSSKEVGLDKTRCMVISRDQNAGQSQTRIIDNSSFEKIGVFRYLGHNFNNSKFYSGRI